MHKRRVSKVTRGRGRGGRQRTAGGAWGGVSTAARPLQEKYLRVNNNYDVELLLVNHGEVKKAPARRGRARSRAVELPSLTIFPVRQQYPPSQRHQGRCRVPRCSFLQPIEIENRTFLLRPPVFHVQSMSIDQTINICKDVEKNATADFDGKWPEDLEELVAVWDSLPHGYLEVVTWLSAPAIPTQIPIPHMVANIQEMMSEWESAYDSKVLQILEWIGYKEVAIPQQVPPKVIVEAQPCSDQNGGEWSSMAKQREQ